MGVPEHAGACSCTHLCPDQCMQLSPCALLYRTMVDPFGVEFDPFAYCMVGWCVGVGFVYFEFGQECVHEGVGVCSGLSGCYIYLCNHYIYLCILMCPCWQGLFQFS